MSFYKSAETYYAEMTSTMTDVDVSKHSLVYNSLMPCCYELSYQSLMLDEATKMIFASTALANKYYDYLVLRCTEQGLTQKTASSATGVIKITGTIGYTLPAGTLLSTTTGLTYTTDADATLTAEYGYVNITASATGTSYNVDANTITVIPVKYSGIASVTNESAITNGVDAESYEALYNRYLTEVQNPSTGGNKTDYENWALSCNNVGSATILPLWNGVGTVKVVIASSTKGVCDASVVTAVAEYIEEKRPVCSGVITVVSVEELALNISMTLAYDSVTYTLATVKSNIETAITTYLEDLDLGITSIKYNKILSIIMNATGVMDISNLLVNSVTSNVTLSTTQVAALGTVTCNVA